MIFDKKRSGGTTVLLLVPPSSSAAFSGGEGGKLVNLQLEEGWEESSVDLGAIGWLTALDPLSIRLNGYMLGARPPDYIAASVTWGSLLAHFFARRLPSGGAVASSGDPILVHGRPAPSAAARRRTSSDGERPLKRVKLMSDDLHDDESSKRMRTGDDLGADVSSNGVSGSFFGSRGAALNCLARQKMKRSREDDLAVAELPSKRLAWYLSL